MDKFTVWFFNIITWLLFIVFIINNHVWIGVLVLFLGGLFKNVYKEFILGGTEE